MKKSKIYKMESVLKKIINNKKEKIKNYKKDNSINKILENIKNFNNFIDFKEELPRLPTGKLYKRLLRDKYWAKE